MSENNDKELTDALLTGVLGLSAVFFSMKGYFLKENDIVFGSLIFVYLVASMLMVFGIILNSTWIKKDFCLIYCRTGLIPYTIWAAARIFFTEMKLFSIGTIVSFYLLLISEYLILNRYYLPIYVKFRFQMPIIMEILKKKPKVKPA